MTENKTKLLSKNQAAKYLSIRKERIDEFIEKGKIGFIEIGKRKKISVMELENFIKSNSEKINPLSPKPKDIESLINRYKNEVETTSEDIDQLFKKLKEKK